MKELENENEFDIQEGGNKFDDEKTIEMQRSDIVSERKKVNFSEKEDLNLDLNKAGSGLKSKSNISNLKIITKRKIEKSSPEELKK